MTLQGPADMGAFPHYAGGLFLALWAAKEEMAMFGKFTGRRDIMALTIFAGFMVLLFALPKPAFAQSPVCVNQCDTNAMLCESNVNSQYDRCLANWENQKRRCEAVATERWNYCTGNNSVGCDLSAEFAFDDCMAQLPQCRADGQRCVEADNICMQRCQEEASRKSAAQYASPKERPAGSVPVKPLASGGNDSDNASAKRPSRVSGGAPIAGIFQFAETSKRNEFRMLGTDDMQVRNLGTNGQHGGWHKYYRIGPRKYQSVSGDATYELLENGSVVWQGNRRIVLVPDKCARE